MSSRSSTTRTRAPSAASLAAVSGSGGRAEMRTLLRAATSAIALPVAFASRAAASTTGSSTQNVLPAPSCESTPVAPPIASASSFASARPSPVPSFASASPLPASTCEKSWKRRLFPSSEMPGPSSFTAMRARPALAVTDSAIALPFGVYFSAFARKLKTIFSSASASTFTTLDASSGASTVKTTPCALHAGAKYSPHERANAAASMGDRCHSFLPAASFWKSRSWFTRRRSRRAFLIATSMRGSREKIVSRLISSSGFRMSVSGVRSSWETFWKKCVFWRSSSTSLAA